MIEGFLLNLTNFLKKVGCDTEIGVFGCIFQSFLDAFSPDRCREPRVAEAHDCFRSCESAPGGKQQVGCRYRLLIPI